MTHFNYRILVVDDDENLRKIAETVLKAQGYEVHLALDGFDGLGELKQALPDVIISDLEMPNMSGFEFLSVVRRRFPQIAVIAISGAFAGANVPSNVPADAFFEKGNYTPPELFLKIIALLQEMPVRTQVVRKVEPALWFPIEGRRSYIAVTCPFCLRTFPLGAPTLTGDYTTACDFCDSAVTIHIPVINVSAAADL